MDRIPSGIKDLWKLPKCVFVRSSRTWSFVRHFSGSGYTHMLARGPSWTCWYLESVTRYNL